MIGRPYDDNTQGQYNDNNLRWERTRKGELVNTQQPTYNDLKMIQYNYDDNMTVGQVCNDSMTMTILQQR